jgi:uncharacterized protein YndB with AHSA1/START domain
VSSWKQQGVIDAPVEQVWEYVGDPRRYPEWASEVVSVTGLATLAPGEEFSQVTRTPFGSSQTTFRIEEIDELREIKLRCEQTGYYARWLLTEAQSTTFAEVEVGIDPTATRYRLLFSTVGRRFLRRIAEQAIDGLRSTLTRDG